VSLPELNVVYLQGSEFCAAQSATEKNRNHGEIPLAAKRLACSSIKQHPSLFNVQPVS
jgi:hypothetical protein